MKKKALLFFSLYFIFSTLFAAPATLSSFTGYGFFPSSQDLKIELLLSLRMIVAAVLGAGIGFCHNREFGIGPLIYCAIATGSSLFTSVMLHAYLTLGNQYALTGLGGLVTGVGFIGGSVIFKTNRRIEGMVSAATLWATMAVGVACGFGMNIIAVLSAVIVGALNYSKRRSGKE